MRIGVLRNTQSESDRPWHFVSSAQSKEYVRQGTHYRISKYVIRENVVIATANVKKITPPLTKSSSPERHFVPRLQVVKVDASALLPPAGSATLNLFYPVRDMSSFGPRNFKEIWGCAVDEWQQRIGAH